MARASHRHLASISLLQCGTPHTPKIAAGQSRMHCGWFISDYCQSLLWSMYGTTKRDSKERVSIVLWHIGARNKKDKQAQGIMARQKRNPNRSAQSESFGQ